MSKVRGRTKDERAPGIIGRKVGYRGLTPVSVLPVSMTCSLPLSVRVTACSDKQYGPEGELQTRFAVADGQSTDLYFSCCRLSNELSVTLRYRRRSLAGRSRCLSGFILS
jgi:hypothetical protein